MPNVVPPPGMYRLSGVSPFPPFAPFEVLVVVPPEFGVAVVDETLVMPFIETPDPLVPGPSSGVTCGGAGEWSVYLGGVKVAHGPCVPVPPPPP